MWSIAVFASNEAQTVPQSLQQFSATMHGQTMTVQVLANGCRDKTSAVVEEYCQRHPHVKLHVIELADKANAWNVYVHDLAPAAEVHFFSDGNKTIVPGSLERLAAALHNNPYANAAAALPMNGRSRRQWRSGIRYGQRVAGGLYALRGTFIQRLREHNVYLPTGVLCNDAVISLFADTNLGEYHLAPGIVHDVHAGFFFHSLSPFRLGDYPIWFKRKFRIALKGYQQQFIGQYLQQHDLKTLPAHIDEIYDNKFVRLETRWFRRDSVFHLLALRHIRERMRALSPTEPVS